MKTSSVGRWQTVFLGPMLAIAAGLAMNYCAAVTSLTISPSTYTLGDVATPVTVQANTATPGNELTFDVYVDADGDGTLDPGEARFMSLSVADGQVPHLGNTSFWHDEDGAENSSVKAALIANGFWWRFSGHFIVKVTDEDSSTATASFTVAQDTSYPCVVTGQVQLGGSPAGGAILAIQDLAAYAMVSMHLADADGRFELRVQSPGGYGLRTARPGSVAKFDEGSGQMLQVSEGSNPLSQPLVLFPGNRTISGRVFASDTGEGFRGTLVMGDAAAAGLLSVAVTDDDGSYTLNVMAAEWEVSPWPPEDISRLGYVIPYFWASVSGSNVEGINLSCPRATTLITGTVKDKDTGQGLQGIPVWATIGRQGPDAVGCSGPDGSYAVGVIEGDWGVEIYQRDLFGTGYAPPPSQHVTAPASGQVRDIDFALEGPFAMRALRWSGQLPGALELHWTPKPGATYRVFWSTGTLDNGMTWDEVPNAQDDIRQEGDTMIWTDRGTAPGMNGSPGDPGVGQRFYKVLEMPD